MLPLATIIILAGLSSIPQDIHDAAAVDGAGFWLHLFDITLPLVAPVGVVALLFGIVFTFTDLIVVFVLTRGGPYDTTQVLTSWTYFTGIQGGDLAGGARFRETGHHAPAAPQEELMWPRDLRRYWARHQRSGRAGRGPDETTGLL